MKKILEGVIVAILIGLISLFVFGCGFYLMGEYGESSVETETEGKRVKTIEVTEVYEIEVEAVETVVGSRGVVTEVVGIRSGARMRAIGAETGVITSAYEGELVFRNLTIEDATTDEYVAAYDGYLKVGGRIRFENCTFVNSIYVSGRARAEFEGCTFNSETSRVYSVWVGDGSAKFTNCLFTGYRGVKIHEFEGESVDAVKITSCEFRELRWKPGLAIGTFTEPSQTIIKVTESKFFNCANWDREGSLMGEDGFYESDTDIGLLNFTEQDNEVTHSEDFYWTDIY